MKSFKQKAIFAAVGGASMLLAGGAGAVNVNHEGLGEVLLYPYYTVRNGNSTLISVVNTTTAAKVVKVRFIEGKNSSEVLDFNLWLSPNDVWTAAVVATPTGAGLVSGDTSCTNPAVNTGAVVPFRNTAFLGDRPELRGLDRTREGYVELIEMATVLSTSATYAAVVHKSTGKPDCVGTFVAGGTFPVITNNEVNVRGGEYGLPTGGLFGNGTIVGNSMANGYNATAIEGFGYNLGPTTSNNLLPSLASGTNRTAVVVDSPSSGTSRITAAVFGRGIDAVSASIMHSAVLGEYAYSNDAAGAPVLSTDWVVTMPTKRSYVNPVATAPFQRAWTGADQDILGYFGNGTACDDVTLNSYDREEGSSFTDDDFSPSTTPTPRICYEANVISFGGLAGAAAEGTLNTGPSRSLGSTNARGYVGYQRPGKEGGWAAMTFRAGALLGATATSQTTTVIGGVIGTPVTGPVTFAGLPTIGFAVSDYRASAANGNYNAGYNLNFRRSITQQ
jgi:hypothetical protein